ncbi:MAG: DUF1028 domain-containing protein [Pseudonocardiaceae bacterium]
MTFSIVACNLRDEVWGVAVASRFLAVGSMVPAAEIDAGALATQAQTNMSFRKHGLAMLRAGLDPQEVLANLLADDEERKKRQVGLVDRRGNAVTWTGCECQPFAGGRSGGGYAVQGNFLQGPEVLDAMAESWLTSDKLAPLPHRLLAALASGDASGGDRRGRQAAALFVVRRDGHYRYCSDVEVDLRVDDSEYPISELRRLLALHDELPIPP